MPVQLIKIPPAEIGTVAELATRIWHAYYIEIISVEQIEYMLRKFYSDISLAAQISEGHEFYRIAEGKNTYGFVSISRKSDTEYFIHKFYILPEQHRKHIGSEVMQLITGEVKSRNNSDLNIRLTVNRKNYRAINFYFRNGFVIEKVEDFDIGNGYFMNDFVMILRVTR